MYEFYNPGSKPTRTFNIHLYLNHPYQVQYQRVDHPISVIHRVNVLDPITNKPNQCP